MYASSASLLMVNFCPRISTSRAFFICPTASVGQIPTRELAHDFIEFLADFDALALILAYLTLEVVPLAFFLLELFLDRLLLAFHALMGFEKTVDGRLELFDIVDSHRRVRRKTSCLSLVSTSDLVKLK